MEEKSKKLTKALKVFGKALKDLGINDWVLAAAFEEEGQEAQQIMVNGDVDRVARLLITAENEPSEDLQDCIIMHRMERLLKEFGKIEEEE